MITCNLMGGLGNQIFQIFTTLSYAIKCGQIYNFSDAQTLGGGSTTTRHTYWDTFFKELKPFTVKYLYGLDIIREKQFTYDNELYNEIKNKPNIMLYGYFQSYKYFTNEFNTICNLIKVKELTVNALQKSGYNANVLMNSVSMHFRIGDYKNIQQCHPLMDVNFYDDALRFILSKKTDVCTVLCFCEDDDIAQVVEMITFLKHKYPDIIFERCFPLLEDWEQMLIMSLCGDNIIANSSFSWWGAFFNENKNKIVCYPSKWFGPSINHDTSDLFPPEWKQIDCSNTVSLLSG